MTETGTAPTRRLAAILAADVVGYSRLMGADEAGTVARLRSLFREVVQPAVTAQRGRVFKLMGDAFLAEFGSAVAAVTCAAALQEALAAAPGDPTIVLRIGLHLGDVLVEGGDLLGDGVNVAARIEGVAAPGGVALSGDVANAVRGRVPFGLEDLGEQALKNIERPVRVFRLVAKQVAGPVLAAEPALALPDKPSLVVLPFQNMSGDAEQDYFVDGLVEDITTALACMPSFFVIARNSAFTYKGRAVDVRQVGRDLGVRYVLEGSVRKAAARLRVTGQLIDATTGAHLWADRYDGEVGDTFSLQDRLTEAVAGAVQPELLRAEILRAQRKPTQDLGAYELFLRGWDRLMHEQGEGLRTAKALFHDAVRRDPGYGAAYAMAAMCVVRMKTGGLLAPSAPDIPEALMLAHRAAEFGENDAMALWGAGVALAQLGMDPLAGAELLERSRALNPNSAPTHSQLGLVQNFLGRPDQAVESCTRAMRLSPKEPTQYSTLNILAGAHLQAGRHDEAIACAEMSVRARPDFLPGRRVLVAALALGGRIDDAKRAATALQALSSNNSIARVMGPYPAAYLAQLREAYRLAGMPE